MADLARARIAAERPLPHLEPQLCKGCGRCIGACPKHCIAFGDRVDPRSGLVPVVLDLTECNACGLCLAACPEPFGLVAAVAGDGAAAAGTPDGAPAPVAIPDRYLPLPERQPLAVKGNHAAAIGALLAGCRTFYGYPITPSTEGAELMARLLPELGGVFVQAVSEVAAVNHLYGAAGAGVRAMTFTSSPGFSLMLEGISYLVGAELPTVICNVMRGGPGLGNIAPEQSDIKLVCRGLGHGHTHAVVLAPASPQEMLDLTMLAFELAFNYRNPVVVVADGYLGQMTGRVELPPYHVLPGTPAWAVRGDREHRRNLISSIHLAEADLEAHNLRLVAKYERIAAAEQRAELYRTDDAEVVLVAATPRRAWPRARSRCCASAACAPASSGRSRSGLFRCARSCRSSTAARAWWSSRRAPGSSRTSFAWRSATPAGRRRPSARCAAWGRAAVARGDRERGRRHRRSARDGAMSVFYERFERHGHGEGLKGQSTHYCPGCGHGLIQKYLAEAIEELGVQDRTVAVSPVGCAVFMYYYLDVGNTQAAHGRAPAVAVAHKLANPDAVVVSYQGDGDLASIGLAEILAAAGLGVPLSVVFVNNAIYGMTGGQMAPTSLPGQVTATSPRGRGALEGPPLRMAELVAQLDGPVYVERVALYDAKQRNRAKKAIRKALELQIAGRGFAFVEVLAECPTHLAKSPEEAEAWVRGEMTRHFPLGVKKDAPAAADAHPIELPRPDYDPERLLATVGAVVAAPPRFAAGFPEQLDARDVGVKLAGAGGDGAQTAALLLTHAAIHEGFDATHIPSYGPESRGGTSYADVRIARGEVLSPRCRDRTCSSPSTRRAWRSSLRRCCPGAP
jgi:pyruvate/2-oxoacid:ferredoxin oxidoreductase beta subunit/NAD-dependent dihydropyrimidine dehydrogenase PreA subunit